MLGRSLCRVFTRSVSLQASGISNPALPPVSRLPPYTEQKSDPQILPSAESEVKIYTFPTLNKCAIKVPTIKEWILEKSDMLKEIVPIEEPSQDKKPAMYARRYIMQIRRKKMKKHKRRKRFNRDYFKYQTYHRAKKLKAETLFRARMTDIINDLETFNPMEYVKDTIRRAKYEYQTSLAPSGRRKYPHWYTLMTLEELFGIEKSDYIKKISGLPSEEDEAKAKQLRSDYFKKYVRTPSSNSNSNDR